MTGYGAVRLTRPTHKSAAATASHSGDDSHLKSGQNAIPTNIRDNCVLTRI